MPEGDSIRNVVARLGPRLVGRSLVTFELRDRGSVPALHGESVEDITAHGKHMFVDISPKWVLRVHLGMHGRWRRYPGVELPRFRVGDKLVALGTAEETFVCLRGAQAELVHRHDLRLEQRRSRLGPDILGEEFPLERALARSRRPELASRIVADILVDQRVVAGIGNVWRSEVMFLCGVHPQIRGRAIEDATWRSLYSRARELMQANISSGPRVSTTTKGGRRHPSHVSPLWVYRRRGLPCLRCKAEILRAEVGDMARSVYWCPRCQPEPES